MNRRRFLKSSALASAVLPTFAVRAAEPEAAKAPELSPLLAELEQLLPMLMAETHVPGCSIAVVKAGTPHWRRAFGVKDRATMEPVADDTVFEAASVSKTVFAYLVMKLCERGVLALDTPLVRYGGKRFLEGDPRLDQITARQVLSHTSGFQNMRSGAEPLKIHFTPGEKYLYSGEGYFYLQSVVTHLIGKTNPDDCAKFEDDLEVCATDIDDTLKQNLLTPFGLTLSGYVWNDTLAKHAARPHDREGQPTLKKKTTATSAARYAAAGDLHTTPSDYVKFLLQILAPKPADAFRLNAASLKEMFRPQVKVNATTSWALGWQVRHTPQGDFIEHGGNNTGFHSYVSASVERQSGYVIMTNGDLGWQLMGKPAFTELMTRILVA